MARVVNIEVDQGDTLSLQVTCYRKDDVTLIDLTGALAAWFTVRHTSNAADPQLLQKTLGQGITITNPTGGVLIVTGPAADMAQLATDAQYYDVVIVEADGTRSTQLKGRLVVNPHPNPS